MSLLDADRQREAPRLDPLARACFWLGLASLGCSILAVVILVTRIAFFESFFPLWVFAVFLGLLSLVLAPIAARRVWKGAGEVSGTRQVLLGGSAGFVAFALCLLAVALPHLPEPRFKRNEPSAIHSLRVLNTALLTYHSTFKQGFPDSLSKLGRPASGRPNANNADLLDDYRAGRGTGGTTTSFSKAGYNFTYTPGPRNAQAQVTTYTITARPLVYKMSGRKSFFTDGSSVIRATAEDRDATAQDPPI